LSILTGYFRVTLLALFLLKELIRYFIMV
jgi:hypothetical protein